MINRSFIFLALATLVGGPALAAKPEKNAKAAGDIAIKALEGQIHQLREDEKTALKTIDEKFDYIIGNMAPKEMSAQLTGVLLDLVRVADLLSLRDDGTTGGLNYGDHRVHAQESIDRAVHQMAREFQHEGREERAKTAEALGDVHADLINALAFSAEHPGRVNGVPNAELERRVIEIQRLIEASRRIELAHQLLAATDHEIKDFKAEKVLLEEKRDAERHTTKEEIKGKVKEIEEQIRTLKGK